jgi:hypothetical protein
MPELSASSASQMAQAFRFLGLLRPDGQVTPELRLLVEHPESRPTILPKLFRQSYPELFGQGSGPLSEGSIEELIARTGLSPATQRKAVSFVLNAASYMNQPVEMSPPADLGPGPSAAPGPSGVAGGGASSRKSLLIELASGGLVEISVDIDPLRLDKEDRIFVFDLIDRARSYRDDREREKKRESQENDDRPATYRGDTEVPF